MDKNIYLVIIVTGDSHDYIYHSHFATTDRDLALEWIDRFNKIIEDNEERIIKYDIDLNDNTPFWHDYITYDKPMAMLEEIKIR